MPEPPAHTDKRAHPWPGAQAAAFPVPNELMGELVAVAVVLKPLPPGAPSGGDVAAELVAWCRERLAHYKVPSQVRAS